MNGRPVFYNPHTGALRYSVEPPAPTTGFLGIVDIPVVDDVGDFIEDGVSSVWSNVPGSKWVDDITGVGTGLIGDFVSGPLKDFANTAVGETIIRAISITLMNAAYMVPVVGGALALCTLAIPGMAKGDDWDKAFLDESIYRLEQVANYFAGKAGESAAKEFTARGGEEMAKATKTLFDKAKAAYPNLSPTEAMKALKITPKQLADELGIREDMAAMVLAYVKKEGQAAFDSINKPGNYDMLTGQATFITLGKRKLPTGVASAPSKPPETPAEWNALIAKAKAAGQKQVIIDALIAKRDAFIRANAVASSLSYARATGRTGTSVLSSSRAPAITSLIAGPPTVEIVTPPGPIYYNTTAPEPSFDMPAGEPEVLPNEPQPGLSKSTMLVGGVAVLGMAGLLFWHFTR